MSEPVEPLREERPGTGMPDARTLLEVSKGGTALVVALLMTWGSTTLADMRGQMRELADDVRGQLRELSVDLRAVRDELPELRARVRYLEQYHSPPSREP